MLRNPNLIPLSRQHQHALALCVRINRAQLSSQDEVAAWQAEIQQHFEQEIRYHFEAEETNLFPAARRHPELMSLVDELLTEHTRLRSYFTSASSRTLTRDGLRQFAEVLSGHIRKEERQLFEGMQEMMPAEQLQKIGTALGATLAAVPQACIIPAESTRGKPDP